LSHDKGDFVLHSRPGYHGHAELVTPPAGLLSSAGRPKKPEPCPTYRGQTKTRWARRPFFKGEDDVVRVLPRAGADPAHPHNPATPSPPIPTRPLCAANDSSADMA